jgi:serine/threonine-protein kinase
LSTNIERVTAAETDRVGQIIDKRYQITEELGRGGMGTVYRAEHVRLRRPMAVKLLHSSFRALPEIGRRFEREAFAAARLDHPNCVAVTDFGELEDGTLYLAMEMVDGTPLDELVEAGRIDPERALRITAHVLRGLAHAHEAEIVHRDVKPENIILIDRDGDDSFAKLLDFGIAKLRGAALEEEGGEKLTQAGVAFGTPIYISPEQASGSEVDGRADLYSTSCVLFEMLTGRPPFDHEDRLKILSMHLAKEPPSLGELVPALADDSELDALVQKGLAKRPEERYQSAADYIAAIDGYLERRRARAEPSPPAASARAATPVPTRTPARAQTPLLHAPAGSRTPLPPLGAVQQPWYRQRNWMIAGGCAVGFLLLLIISAIAGGDGQGDVNRAQLRRRLERQLVVGKTCQERLTAVRSLRQLGDKRSIKALRKARYRMRGGIAGIGDKNTNYCLRREAEAAIKELRAR